jgi:GT2 family glycosyltransferase
MQVVDVSVVIANWNLNNLLYECLQSVHENSENVIFEVIVVDNGSSDGSVEMVRKYFPYVRLIENTDNLGFNVATNQAIEASQGRYMLLLNNDTVVTPGTLAQLVEYMDAHPGVGIVGPKLVYPDGRLQWSCHHFETLFSALWMALFLYRLFPRSEIFGRYNMTYWDYNDTREVDWLMATCMLVRREAISEVGLLRDEGFAGGADADWCFRFWQHGWSVVYYHQAIVVHHHGKSSIAYDGDKAVDWRAQSILEAFLSNAGLFSRRHNRFELRLYIAIRKLGAAIRLLLWMTVFLFSNKKFSAKAKLKGQWMILKTSFPNV